MATTLTDTGSFRFSTRNTRRAERPASWNNSAGREISRRVLVPPRSLDGTFHLEAMGYVLERDAYAGRPRGSVMQMTVTAGGTATRTPALLADGNDDIVLHIQTEGRRVVAQRGREAVVESGGGVLTSNADTSTIFLPGPARFVCVAAPRTLMTALAPRVEDALVRALPPRTEVLQLLTTYLDVLDDAATLGSADLRAAVATHIYDLCALAIGAARDSVETAARRGLRAARLHAVKADISSNLAHGDVSAAALAARHGVTPRYLYKLFETEGTTLSKYKLGQRLARVHRRLVCGGGSEPTKISTIAYEAGFGDLSTFNREFRRHFGAKPSDVRRAPRD